MHHHISILTNRECFIFYLSQSEKIQIVDRILKLFKVDTFLIVKSKLIELNS